MHIPKSSDSCTPSEQTRAEVLQAARESESEQMARPTQGRSTLEAPRNHLNHATSTDHPSGRRRHPAFLDYGGRPVPGRGRRCGRRGGRVLVTYIFAVAFIAAILAWMVLWAKYRQLRDYDPWEEFYEQDKKGK